MTENTADLMSRLRDETRAQHEATEKNPFMRALMDRSLSREEYAEAVGQFAQLHEGIEDRLRLLCEKKPLAEEVLEDHHFLVAGLAEQDLADLGAPRPAPNAGVRKFLDKADRWLAEDPLAFLGMFYVLEGSTNGAKMLIKHFKEHFDFEGEAGTRWLDPHGDEQRIRWRGFKESMNELGLSPVTRDNMVRAADEAFDAVGLLYEEVMAPTLSDEA